ncbi:hypothetical protein, partial [Nocardiopsis gilva]|uniref:hypothetical protein n=1 Tax=Nocardiopsis gilva TaxID=280236 RepID=UPI00052468F8
MADRIIVLEMRRIRETGTHDELLRADRRYAEFYRIRTSAYHGQVLEQMGDAGYVVSGVQHRQDRRIALLSLACGGGPL